MTIPSDAAVLLARDLEPFLRERLEWVPAVVLHCSRHVGKTTFSRHTVSSGASLRIFASTCRPASP